MMLLWTSGCRYLFKLVFSFPLDIFPEVELLDHMVVLFLIVWEYFILFPLWFHQYTTPPIVHKGSLFSTFISASFLTLVFLKMTILIVIRWFLTMVLVCSSLMTSDVEHLFICFLAICISLEKCLIKFFAVFFFNGFFVYLLLGCRISLYILDIDPLSDIWFASIFSLSLCCLLILVIESFHAQKFLFLMKSTFSIFYFVTDVFAVMSNKSLPNLMS